ncbi:hypothetical protein GCM10027577_14320 [Spirosoma fluminis]
MEAYYDQETDAYLKTYGKIIQSARPASDDELIAYFSDSMGIRDGMHLLDAGCGVCGPAVGLAKTHTVTIEAITISDVQVRKSRQYVAENQLDQLIHVAKADYANLAELYPPGTFDLVFFLETLGYANDVGAVLKAVTTVLKPGGSVYIKDFFLVPILDEDKRDLQRTYTESIRREYLYRIPDLTDLVDTLRAMGLFLEFIRPMAITEDFTRAALFETVNTTHAIYTKTMHTPFQLFESLELKFRKVYP